MTKGSTIYHKGSCQIDLYMLKYKKYVNKCVFNEQCLVKERCI